MLALGLLAVASLTTATGVIHRRQDNRFTNPVEPTVVKDEPTSSNTINFSNFHPSAASEASSSPSSSEQPTFVAQTTFPSLTGTDLIIITGTNSESKDGSEQTSSPGGSSITQAVTTRTESHSTTTSAVNAQTTRTEGAALTHAPGKAAAGVVALLGLAAVL